MFWPSLSKTDWKQHLGTKSKEERERFLRQAFAVLRKGNRLAKARASWIFGSSHSMNKFQRSYPKLLKLRQDKGFTVDQAAVKLGITVFQVEQLLDIPFYEEVMIEAWQHLCVLLAAQYEPLLVRIAKKMFGNWKCFRAHHADDYFESFDELMVRAVRSYDNPKIKFITYLWHVARHAINRNISKVEGRPEARTYLENSYRRKEQELFASGKKVDPWLVAEELGLNRKEARELLVSLRQIVLSEQDLPASLDNMFFSDNLCDKNQSSLKDLVTIIDQAGLSPLERASFRAQPCLREYFEGDNFVAVAKKYNVSHQAVSQALVRASEKLRIRLRNYYSFAQ